MEVVTSAGKRAVKGQSDNLLALQKDALVWVNKYLQNQPEECSSSKARSNMTADDTFYHTYPIVGKIPKYWWCEFMVKLCAAKKQVLDMLVANGSNAIRKLAMFFCGALDSLHWPQSAHSKLLPTQ